VADIVRRGGPDRTQLQADIVFQVLSMLLAAQCSCTKGLGADSPVSNAICDPQVRAAMLQGIQLLVSALDDQRADRAVSSTLYHLHFTKDSDLRRLVGLCSLMLQVRTASEAATTSMMSIFYGL